MNVRELVDYYAGLLIIQYAGKPRAYATMQTWISPVVMPQTTIETIAFEPVPTSGTFVLVYNGAESLPINWDDDTPTVQSKLRGPADVTVDGGNATTPSFPNLFDAGNASTFIWVIEFDGSNAFGFDLNGVVVTGSIAGGLLTVTFDGVPPPAYIFELGTNTLLYSGVPVIPVIEEIDETLPLAVQDGFNLTVGSSTAVGAQLDVLGTYVGVSRTGNGFSAVITLGDEDFLSLIRLAVVKNAAESSLAAIQALLFQFFPGSFMVFDHLTMRMSFLISTAVGSQDLIQLFITEGLLPVPMAVGFVVIYAPVIDHFFGFRTYAAAAANAEPFNDYADYQTDWPWLTYADAVSATM